MNDGGRGDGRTCDQKRDDINILTADHRPLSPKLSVTPPLTLPTPETSGSTRCHDPNEALPNHRSAPSAA
jgi:hypothetical protein